MTGIKRRGLLRAIAASGLLAPTAYGAPLTLYPGEGRFLHGVASGDPGQHDVIVWTRVTPTGDAGHADIPVDLEVAEDPAFSSGRRLLAGLRAVAGRDHTLKHTLRGLNPGRDYYFRFHCRGATSDTGRTRTLPADSIESLRFAVASCALWSSGFFHAYEAIAGIDKLDAVIHLGDYIYEYGAAADDYGMHIGAKIGRAPEPAHRLVTLSDYRVRHAQYKRDPSLQRAHACAPWITVWDDHELANDSWQSGDDTTDEPDSPAWNAKKVAALRAYYEWMPIREPLANDRQSAACRTFRFGDLAELIMVESRLTGRGPALNYERDLKWSGDTPDTEAFNRILNTPQRQMLGHWQERWLRATLAQSVQAGVGWQVLGNQVLMARVAAPSVKSAMEPKTWEELLQSLSEGSRKRVLRNESLSAYDIPSNLDAWDGYPAARTRVYDAIRETGARVVALAGDTHMAWANELRDDTGRRMAAEFATTSVTSPSYGDYLPQAPIGEAMAARNPEVIYNDPRSKGFLRIDLNREAVTAQYVVLSGVTARAFSARTSAIFSATRTDRMNPAQIGPVRRDN